MTRALTYVEIDLEHCSNVFGEAPCTATGVPCFNSQRTCRDIANFTLETLTLRFAMPTAYLPRDIPATPSLIDVSTSPATVSFGTGLGQRATVDCSFQDHRHSDAGLDPYLSDRNYDPFKQGTFWGKFRARYPYLTGRPLRVIRGFLGQSIEEMEVEHYIIDRFEGPTPLGTFTITGKDTLKMADDAKAQAPRVSNGSLVADITDSATSLVLSPVGIGDLEYDGDGYLAIGGKEIVEFQRDAGVDAHSLLLHFNSGDGDYVDSSPNAYELGQSGSVRQSSATPKFGTDSALFTGAGYLYAKAFDEEIEYKDFSIDLWAKVASIGSRQTLVDTTATGSTEGVSLSVDSDGSVLVEVNGSEMLRSTDPISGAIWTHINVSRRRNVFHLVVAGVLQSTAFSYTEISVGESRPIIGASGNSPGLYNFTGNIDELRIVIGSSLRTRDGAVPTAATTAASGDTVQITARGALGTSASSAKAQDRAQKCVQYTSRDPSEILFDLFTSFASMPVESIPLSSWVTQTKTYLQRVYSSVIAEPTGVNTLASELIEQASLVVWWDPSIQQVGLEVLRTVESDAAEVSPDNRVEGTFATREQPETRVSQVWTYYAQVNPLKSVTDPSNYRSVAATVDLENEGFYGSPSIKKIHSRWIAEFGRSVALALNDVVLSRFSVPPRIFSFSLFVGDDRANVTGGLFVTGPMLQLADGSPDRVPSRVRRIAKGPSDRQIESEEILGGVTPADLNDRAIIIDADTLDFNLRTVHDTLYPEIDDATGITLTLTIDAGVIVSSSDVTKPAINIGSWVDGLSITVINNGRVQGSGGRGGGMASNPAEDGGTAIYTRYPITIENNGSVYGGGGGGGAYIYNGNTSIRYAGGGGAGRVPGASNTSYAGAGSSAGTLDAGGAGSPNGGGKGGGPGQAGARYSTGGAGAPGDAGSSFDGSSYVTKSIAGDIKGPEVN